MGEVGPPKGEAGLSCWGEGSLATSLGFCAWAGICHRLLGVPCSDCHMLYLADTGLL